MSTVLRVRLTGDDTQLGRVAAGDVARMLLGIERAVARAAGHVIGRQVKSTGRRGRAIEETRFRLLSIERGSVVGVLELPEQAANADTLDVDVPSLGPLALGAHWRLPRVRKPSRWTLPKRSSGSLTMSVSVRGSNLLRSRRKVLWGAGW